MNQQASNPPLEISVVVPVHNEEENIEPLIDEIRTALAGRRYEIVYVDDGSTDRSLEILLGLARKYPELQVRAHEKSCGQSTAIRTGVKTARAPWVATLDGDGQNDPADIPLLMELMDDPHRPPELKLINGHRHKRKDTWVKRMSSKVANFVRRSLLHDDTPDSGCGLKLFSREAWLDLPFFDHIHRFTPALFLANGHQVRSVKVHHRPRVRGKSKYGIHNRLWVGIVDLFGVIWLLRRTTRPRLRRLPDASR
ncbi:MAG: dolichol-phosphate mannosyltransferase [Gammaproteobacteria bacterium]|nr:MAG: dolichol-phosphate mannosyltransferase [Gammaproteobacteria bacterium]RTZ73370.1 MAG: dolichol-phosphate mannosyltransferase [Gammaproteobacteria bacterium]